MFSCSSKFKVNETKQLIASLGSWLEHVWGAGSQVPHHPASAMSHADLMHANVHGCMKRHIVGSWSLNLVTQSVFIPALNCCIPLPLWVIFLPLGSVLAAVLRAGETKCPGPALGRFAVKREPLSLVLQTLRLHWLLRDLFLFSGMTGKGAWCLLAFMAETGCCWAASRFLFAYLICSSALAVGIPLQAFLVASLSNCFLCQHHRSITSLLGERWTKGRVAHTLPAVSHDAWNHIAWSLSWEGETSPCVLASSGPNNVLLKQQLPPHCGCGDNDAAAPDRAKLKAAPLSLQCQMNYYSLATGCKTALISYGIGRWAEPSVQGRGGEVHWLSRHSAQPRHSAPSSLTTYHQLEALTHPNALLHLQRAEGEESQACASVDSLLLLPTWCQGCHLPLRSAASLHVA